MTILILTNLTLVLFLTDVFIKCYIENHVKKGEEREILKNKIVIRKVYNEGMCLNFLEKRPDIVRWASAFATVLLTIYQWISLFKKGHFSKKLGLSLMAAGAWSNTLDRLSRHYVVDYFGFCTKWKKVTRITYNLGDLFIGIGSVLVVISSLFQTRRKRH